MKGFNSRCRSGLESHVQLIGVTILLIALFSRQRCNDLHFRATPFDQSTHNKECRWSTHKFSLGRRTVGGMCCVSTKLHTCKQRDAIIEWSPFGL